MNPQESGMVYDMAKKLAAIDVLRSSDFGQLVVSGADRIQLMQKELDAGSWKVIAEARESGTVGVFRKDGEIRSDLIEEILTKIPNDKILWEAPKKDQQVWFIKLMGSNVNLGNIPVDEIINLETLRLGLRGDTVQHFHLDKNK